MLANSKNTISGKCLFWICTQVLIGLFGSAHILEKHRKFPTLAFMNNQTQKDNKCQQIHVTFSKGSRVHLPVCLPSPCLQSDGFIAKLASFTLNCSGSFLIWSSFSSLWMKQCFCWFSTSSSPGHRLRKSGLSGGAAMFCFWPLVVRGGSASPLLSEIRVMEKAGSLGGFLLRIRFAVDGLLSSTECTLSTSLGDV